MSFHSVSFCYKVAELPQKLNCCLYQFAYGKIGLLYVISPKIAEPNDDIK